MNVADWSRSFRENEIDDTVLRRLTAEDLKDFGVTLIGHRRRVLDAIAPLNDAAPTGEPAETLLRAKLVACRAEKTSIGPVNSCGKIWPLRSGEASLTTNGDLPVIVQGLVLNDPSLGDANGTPDGVDAVAAAVVCVGNNGSPVAAQTDPVPINTKGDAKSESRITLPKTCIAPVVVLRERCERKSLGWLAANTWSSGRSSPWSRGGPQP